jgi:anti-sigma factor RsiW
MRLRLMSRRELVCRQVVELVTDYLEDTLPRGDRRRLDRHLAGCPHCTEYLAQLRVTIRLSGTITPGDLSPQMQDEFIEVFRNWRADQDGPPA